MSNKIMLSGFNNLKKSLSFSFYDFVIATTRKEKADYIKYINENYSAEKINKLLLKIVKNIEAEVLNSSEQNYEPYGASSLILLGDIKGEETTNNSINHHLDKSHISAHTYPDITGERGVLSFRVDIELSTCGDITPLDSLNDIFDFFDNDLITIDYTIRGFTRKEDGSHMYKDHEVNSIKDFIKKDILNDYGYEELNLEGNNIWQLKMIKENMIKNDYFHPDNKLLEDKKVELLNNLETEMKNIFKGR